MTEAANDNDPFANLRKIWLENPEGRFSAPPGVINYLSLIGKIKPVDGLYNWIETTDALNEFMESPQADEPIWRLTALHNGVPLWRAAQEMDRVRQQVYFIGASDEAIKIGTSTSPRSRIRELQTGNWHTLSLLGSMPGGENTESEIHKMFAHLHLRGEWYAMAKEILNFIDENCAPLANAA